MIQGSRASFQIGPLMELNAYKEDSMAFASADGRAQCCEDALQRWDSTLRSG